jgi:hypothetical protein
MELTLTQAEHFVDTSPRAIWDGWSLVIYRPEPNAWAIPKGAFFKGRWCYRAVIEPNEEGKYVITKGNAINAAKPWHRR